MVKITLGIDGMHCGMCEASVNDTIRKSFDIKKVTSSHSKNTTEIICGDEVSERDLKKALDPTGYRVTSYKCEPYEKKGFFSFGKN